MEPLHPHKEPDVDTVERARLIRDVYAAGIALKDYFTKDALCKIFQELNNKSLIVCVHEQGFPSIDALLLYTKKFTSAMIHNKVQYKALEPAEDQATRELFSLVNRQTSKKKKVKPPKVNTAHRQYFDRSKVRSQSFHGRTSAFGAGFIKPQIKLQPVIPPTLSKLSKELRSRLTFDDGGQPAQSFAEGSTSGIFIPKPDHVVARKSSPRSKKGTSSTGATTATSTSGPSICTPAAGVQRFVDVLNKHNGVATSDQLKKTYRELYGVDWDAAELKRYFGLSSSRDVVENFLSGLVEITSLKGTGGMRCYRLLHPSAAMPTRRPPSMEELYEHLLEILIDKEPEPINLKSLTSLYKQKYAMELDPETQFGISWKDLILHNFSASFCVDKNGRLQLNMENLQIKKKVLEKQVQAALDADIDNDSFDSSSSSALSSTSYVRSELKTSRQISNGEQGSDGSVYVDVNRRCRREIHEEPIERTFRRNMRLTQSCRGRVTVTAYRDDNGSEDTAERDLAHFKDLPVIHFPASAPHPQTSSTKLQQPAISVSPENACYAKASTDLNGTLPVERHDYLPAHRPGSFAVERPASSLSTRSSSSSMRARCEKNFASIGTFFRRIAEKPAYEARNAGSAVADEYVQRAGSARSNHEKDVSCAHPYFNVHVLSEAGDARSQAVRRGLTINQ